MVALLGLCTVTVGRAADESVELMASSVSWTHSEYVGHAFMLVAYPLNSGIKEESYGFYPKADRCYIGCAGAVKDEFRKESPRFSRVTVSVKKTVTAAQRQAVLKLANEWSEKEYHLTNENCIDFVRSVAKAIGLTVPPRLVSELPEAYMTRLRAANP